MARFYFHLTDCSLLDISMDKNNNIQKHYDQLLAGQYTWVFGDVQSRVEENKILFHYLGLGNGALAVDLGCGPGYHSLALSMLGYEVIAVDTSEALLNELISHDEGKRIKTIHEDIRKIRDIVVCPANLVLCMGDTISLLDSYLEMTELLKDIRQCLSGEGRLILSFRDQTRALEGVDRILPIKNERDRIFTCLLDYEKDKIGVTDILYQFADGKWSIQKSSYKKIRIFSDKLEAIICDVGFKIIRKDEINGFVTLVMEKD